MPDMRDELVAIASREVCIKRCDDPRDPDDLACAQDDAAAVLDSIPPGSFKREDGTWVRLEQMGWTRDDGDEYYDFRYAAPGDRHNPAIPKTHKPVYVEVAHGEE